MREVRYRVVESEATRAAIDSSFERTGWRLTDKGHAFLVGETPKQPKARIPRGLRVVE
jgi:hypothetical protein